MIDLDWPQVQPGERSCQFDSSLNHPWLWHGLSLNGPFKMEIMSKPSIFGGLKRHCAKKQNKRVWTEWFPAPKPILHRCIELRLKSLTKGKYTCQGHLRKDKPHDQPWGVSGSLCFWKKQERGFSPSVSWDATQQFLFKVTTAMSLFEGEKNTWLATAAKMYSTSSVVAPKWHWRVLMSTDEYWWVLA